MKKRSMLAVASLAAGVVASLTAPSAHAGAAAHGDADGSGAKRVLTTAGLLETAMDVDAPHDSAHGHPDRPFR